MSLEWRCATKIAAHARVERVERRAKHSAAFVWARHLGAVVVRIRRTGGEMAERGIHCTSCGASTPLPDDLRVPTFACRFCHAVLETRRFAGSAASSADALLGHMQAAIAQPPADVLASIDAAPRFQGGGGNTRAERCKECGADVAVPLDVEVHTFSCGGCGREQRVDRYVSDRERFELDMQRQVAGNEALKRLEAEGVPCGRCGGHNQVPADGSVQFVCRYCGSAILLSEHVDATAVARQRLAKGVFAMRDDLIRQQEERDRKVKGVVLAVVALVVVFIVGINVLGGS